MKTVVLCIIFFIISMLPCKKATAQYFYDNDSYNNPLLYEAGISSGIMNCITDIGGHKGLGGKFFKDVNLGNNKINVSIYAGAIYREAVGIRIEGTFGTISAYDSILKNVRATTNGRYERNLSFKSKISEIAILAEIYPLFIFFNWQNRDQAFPRLSPYFLGGVIYYSYNPQGILKGKTINLQPLSTEGQGFLEYPERKPYKLKQINFPLGFGFKYDLASKLNLRTEFIYRILTTDYLDDISTKYIDPILFTKYFSGDQLNNALELNDRRSKTNVAFPVNPHGGQIRGNPKNKDAYFTFNIKLGLTLGLQKIKNH